MIRCRGHASVRNFVFLVMAVCLQASVARAAEPALKVVASFSLLADFAREVGGPNVQVRALVGPEGDAHVFEPTPKDARVVQDARVLIANGVGFEAWLGRLKKSSNFKGKEVIASNGVKLRTLAGGTSTHTGHAHGATQDPHAWQSAANAVIYVNNIAEAFAEVDPVNASAYRSRAAAYVKRLSALDNDIRQTFASLAPDRRVFVTTHDAFGYYAQAYGLRILPAQGLSTESEPSAAGMARLVDQIREQRIPAVFIENISNPKLMEQLARETGAVVGGKLYSDALSPPGGPAPTYFQLMQINTRTIADALAAHAPAR